jgi:preprotein translocase subunit YajC
MKIRFLSAIIFGVALTLSAFSQDANPGQRGGHGGWGGMSDGGGITGTVTEVAADHYIIKTDGGETYTIQFSANTRIMKQMVRQRGEGGGNPPQTLKSTDIKVGDAVAALGEVNAAAKSVGAVVVLQLDPERAKQFREMQANFGRTWLMGKVTAINETRISIIATVDNVAHTFVADENTTFRKRHEPITLADLQVGDRVRVEGVMKDGIFVAASVTVMGMPQGGTPTVPRDAAPAPQPN